MLTNIENRVQSEKIILSDQDKSTTLYCFGFALIFMINPMVGILFSSIFAIEKRNYMFVKLLILFLTLYLSALNTTKRPDSDMGEYITMFLRVPVDGFWKTLGYLSITDTPKDVLYSSFVFILYYLLLGNQYLFVFVISFVIFFLAFKAIYRFSLQYKLSAFIIVTQLLTLAFFSQYFSLSSHIIRQQLATSVFLYALSYRAFSLKKYTLICSLACLIHSSIIIIVLVGFIPFIKRKLKKKEIILIVVGALSFMIVFSALGNYVLSNLSLSGESLTNVSRMANMEGARDTTDGGGMVINLLASLMVLISLFEILRKKRSVYPIIVNICFLWSILVLSLYQAPLLQYRFFFIEYIFLPLIIFLPVISNYKLIRLESVVVVCSMVFFFYYNLNGVFKYISVIKAITFPFPFLIKFM